MARPSTSFGRGILAGLLLAIGTVGAHWFITADAYRATNVDRSLTGIQIVIGFGGAAWLALLERRVAWRSAA